ncbi:hypothetical protein CCAX7_30170 [Capsulimonas corticalis]|uniref:Uncharacterized protein n=1 Tax=Capsulimonas corticalis TaxID=2219043 RepID=A0A402CSV1_9BACT|nr:hypothetical protein [Capsulimonas corticalis]BDI30966.1 hypothetical protein CCAX7_30170 [Capsulimonas corticalis]
MALWGTTRVDYENFDNDSGSSDEEYSAFVEWLSELTAMDLREAKGDPEKQKQALCRYYKRGERANLTIGELIDFLGVSSPSIIDMADYTEEEGDDLMQISDALTQDEIAQIVLPVISQS